MIGLILTYMVVFFGLVIGVALAYIAREELATGRKHFIFLRDIIVTLAVLFLLYFYDLNRFVILFMTIIVFLTLINLRLDNDHVLYFFLSVILMLTHKDTTFFEIESILVFLYGFPAGTLFAMKHKDVRIIGKKLVRYAWFFAPLILLLFISYQ